MSDPASLAPCHRAIYIVPPSEPLPELDREAPPLAEAGLWRCAFFHPTLKEWRLRGWRGLPVPEIERAAAHKLNRPSRAGVMEGEAMVLHPVFLDRYVRLWDLEREMLEAQILALCALARRQGATAVVLRRVFCADGSDLPRFFPLHEAAQVGLPVEDPRFLLGAGAPVAAFHRTLAAFDKKRLFGFIKRLPWLRALEQACRVRCAGTLSTCLEQQPFLPRFDELSLALAKLGCRPHDTRMFPTWKLALNITWCFDLEFEAVDKRDVLHLINLPDFLLSFTASSTFMPKPIIVSGPFLSADRQMGDNGGRTFKNDLVEHTYFRQTVGDPPLPGISS